MQLMRNSLFAELRSEFHDGMSELKDEMSGKILNTSRQLVSCHIVCCVLSSLETDIMLLDEANMVVKKATVYEILCHNYHSLCKNNLVTAWTTDRLNNN